MKLGRLGRVLRLAAFASLSVGCLPSIEDLDSGPLNSTFAVSDFFAPSGYMGDGMFFGKLVGTANEGCRPRAGLARGNCYAFTYLPNDRDVDAWAGVFWVFPSNSWGSTSGHAIDATKFKQISFWAAVDGPTPYTVDGNPVPFVGQAGGINPMGRYSDKGELDYIDGVEVKQGFAIGDPAGGVTSEMKQFHIPLTELYKYAGCQEPDKLVAGKKAKNCTGGQAEWLATTAQATFLIGAFAFALHYPTDVVQCSDPAVDCKVGRHSSMYVNPAPVHIYLDDIVWDTQDPPTP